MKPKRCRNFTTCGNIATHGNLCLGCRDLMKFLSALHHDPDDRGPSGEDGCPEAFDIQRRIELHRARTTNLNRILNN